MKRSSQVAVLLAGVTAAGGAGYAMMAPDDCAKQERPGVSSDQTATRCTTGRSSSHTYYSHGQSSFFGSDDSSRHSSSSSSSSSSGSHASLGGGGPSFGGFGGTGHAFHSSGS